jgi:hypothetical protein
VPGVEHAWRRRRCRGADDVEAGCRYLGSQPHPPFLKVHDAAVVEVDVGLDRSVGGWQESYARLPALA